MKKIFFVLFLISSLVYSQDYSKLTKEELLSNLKTRDQELFSTEEAFIKTNDQLVESNKQLIKSNLDLEVEKENSKNLEERLKTSNEQLKKSNVALADAYKRIEEDQIEIAKLRKQIEDNTIIKSKFYSVEILAETNFVNVGGNLIFSYNIIDWLSLCFGLGYKIGTDNQVIINGQLMAGVRLNF